MREPNHERFTAANDMLRGFLKRLVQESNFSESVSEGDLRAVSEQICNPVSQVGEASRRATLDGYLQQQIAEYVHNLRALQDALEKMQCLLLARKLAGAR